MIYAYLRVSTIEQDERNQRLGVDEKAKELGVHIDSYVVDKISGTTEPSERNLGLLLKRVKEGDIIIISELSRFGRRLFILFKILQTLLEKEVKVYSVKDGFTLDDSIQSKCMAFTFGLAAEIERDMISRRTKEALALRKLQGMKLGRPVGSKTRVHKLDQYKEQIPVWLSKGWPKAKIARRCKVDPKTLRKYIRNSLAEQSNV